jgi:hypothetical protein
MNNLIHEATLYLQCEWEELNLKPKHVKIALHRLDAFYDELIPKDTVPSHLEKYIHKERMIYDMFMNGEIVVFNYDPEGKDGNESFYSEGDELEDVPEDFQLVNGVKIMDESDYRELLLANEFTGGYWSPEFNWVVQKSTLKGIVKYSN